MIDSEYKINPFSPNFLQWVDEVYKNHDNSAFVSTKLIKNWGADAQFLSQLHSLLPKIAKKLPSFFAVQMLTDARALEQSTSEAVARWKAKAFPAARLLSLTGGLGVDDWAWAISGTEVHSVDPNEALNGWVIHNAERMNIEIHRTTITAENELELLESRSGDAGYNLIYIDPDQRPNGTRKSFDAADYLPNVFELIGKHPHIAPKWLIKMSPMVDPTWIHNQFSCRTKIFAVGLNGEVKEILVEAFPNEARSDAMDVDAICLETWLDEATQEMRTEVFAFSDGISSAIVSETILTNENTSANESQITNESLITKESPITNESSQTEETSPAEETYLFEPSVTLFAACLQKHIPERFNISAATPNHHFFVAQSPLPAALRPQPQGVQHIFGKLEIHPTTTTPLLAAQPTNQRQKTTPPTQRNPARLWHEYPRHQKNPTSGRRWQSIFVHHPKQQTVYGLAWQYRPKKKTYQLKIICRSPERCTLPKRPTYWEYRVPARRCLKSNCAQQWPAAYCFQTPQCAYCSEQTQGSYHTNS
jgi:hypothetical protein